MKNLIEKFLHTQPQSNKAADVFLAIPRIACGLFLAFGFGSSKFGMPWSGNDLALFAIPDWFVADVAQFGGLFALAPYFFAWIAAASETLGGLALVFGFKTRFASLMIALTMLGAIFLQKWDDGLWAMLPAISFLWVSIYSMVMGSGRLGIDFILYQMLKRERLLNLSISEIPLKPSLQKGLIIIFCLASTSLYSQEERIVTFRVSGEGNSIQSMGLRGSVSPLSWDQAIPLSDEDGDGTYEAKITFNTSSRYVKFKFEQNGVMELEDADERMYWFNRKSEPIDYQFNEYEFYDQARLATLTFTEEQITEDVSTLGKIIQTIHPAVYKYIDSVALQTELDQLLSDMLAQPDLINGYKLISKFAAQIKCSHTFTNPWNQGTSTRRAIFYQPDKLPLTFKRIGKRLFVDKNASGNDQVKRGMEILSINGVASDSIMTNLAQYVTSDGNNYEKKLERLVLTGTDKYAMFDIFYPIVFGSYSAHELTLRDYASSKVSTETVMAMSKTKRTQVLKDRYDDMGTDLRAGWSFGLLSDQVGKLTIKSFAIQRNEFDWKAIIDDAFDQLNENNIPNLIIDIRENEGGQGEVGEYILKRIISKPFTAPAMQSSVRYLTIPEGYKKYINTWDKFPYDFTGKVAEQSGGRYILKQKYSAGGKTYKPRKDGYKGKVFLITDASNSSATHLMAAFAKQVDAITLVGQETGGNQLGTNGSFMFFCHLPNTRIVVDIPVINMFVPPMDGKAEDGGILPDVFVQKTWAGLIGDSDPEVEQILSMINE